MRASRLLSIMIVIAVAYFSTNVASAQSGYPQGCYTWPQYIPCNPGGGSSCSTSYLTSQFTTHGYSFAWNSVVCCGTSIFVPYYSEGICESAELKTPDAVKNLVALQQHTKLMAVGCDGYVRPLPHLMFSETNPNELQQLIQAHHPKLRLQ